MVKSLRVSEQPGMYKISSPETVTIEQLEREMDSLKKKVFLYETLQAEREIKKKQVKGPFRSGKEVLNHLKR